MNAVASPARTLDAVVVLCGGRSRRMGRDKALIELDGRSLIERALDVADAAGSRVFLASGPEARYGELERETVIDRVPEGGPLAGIEAALARLAEEAPDGWLGVLACDMPRAASEVLLRCAERGRERDLDAVWLATEGRLQPLYGALHVRCLPAIRAALDRGERRAIAFHPEVRLGEVGLDELSPEVRASRPERNVNTPLELERERRTS